MTTPTTAGAFSGDEAPGAPGAGATPEAWQATRAQTALATQFMRDEDDYLAAGKPDIGRQISPTERELFVSCDPAQALQQQFEHIGPEFIAVHDIGTTSSRKLLAGVAAASGRQMQKLFIRRQGYGTPLATLEYVELPTTDGSSLRMYTTEADADTVARHGVARMLLAFSRLGVVMVGELPSHALEAAFKPIHEDMLKGPWHNRHMLLLPLGGSSTVVSQGAELARGTGVNVRTTPQVARPADAWGFINGAFARLREQSPAESRPASGGHFPRAAASGAGSSNSFTASLPRESREEAVAPPAPLAMRPMPQVPTAKARVAATGLLERYVQQLSELTGMVSVCVFELSTGRDVTHAGANPAASELGSHGAELVASITGTCRALGLGHAIPEAAITLGAHHLLLRPVPKHPGLALHAVLDKTHANLTLARLQVQRMDALFDEAT
jgi:hypothetical protein